MRPRMFWGHQPQLSCATLLLAAIILARQGVEAGPKPPLPPLPEMGRVLWSDRFDEPYHLGRTNTLETAGQFQFSESWSGYALQRSGRVTPFVISGVDSQGITNLSTFEGGSLRFWIRPRWSTGTGPGTYVPLAQMHVIGERAPVWTLQATPDGSSLRLLAETEHGSAELLNVAVAWGSEFFHLVCLNYSPDSTALFVDGWLVAEGPGVLPVPSVLARLVLGSTLNGNTSAEADFDEAHVFARPLNEVEMARHYQAYRKTISGWSWRQSAPEMTGNFTLSQSGVYEAGEAQLPPGPGEGPYGNPDPEDPGPPPYVLNGQLGFLAPILTASNLTLVITNIEPGAVYDLYYTTNMGLLSAPQLCATNWAWYWRTIPGQTNFVLASLPQPECYFRLGTMYDGDWDGLPDAYEQLVSHTSTNEFTTLASYDNIPGGWLVFQGLIPPRSGIGSQDPDTDALTNWQEYCWGTDPLYREDFRIWVGVPNAVAGIP